MIEVGDRIRVKMGYWQSLVDVTGTIVDTWFEGSLFQHWVRFELDGTSFTIPVPMCEVEKI